MIRNNSFLKNIPFLFYICFFQLFIAYPFKKKTNVLSERHNDKNFISVEDKDSNGIVYKDFINYEDTDLPDKEMICEKMFESIIKNKFSGEEYEKCLKLLSKIIVENKKAKNEKKEFLKETGNFLKQSFSKGANLLVNGVKKTNEFCKNIFFKGKEKTTFFIVYLKNIFSYKKKFK